MENTTKLTLNIPIEQYISQTPGKHKATHKLLNCLKLINNSNDNSFINNRLRSFYAYLYSDVTLPIELFDLFRNDAIYKLEKIIKGVINADESKSLVNLELISTQLRELFRIIDLTEFKYYNTKLQVINPMDSTFDNNVETAFDDEFGDWELIDDEDEIHRTGTGLNNSIALKLGLIEKSKRAVIKNRSEEFFRNRLNDDEDDEETEELIIKKVIATWNCKKDKFV